MRIKRNPGRPPDILRKSGPQIIRERRYREQRMLEQIRLQLNDICITCGEVCHTGNVLCEDCFKEEQSNLF
jgi:hypothetical protein